ncbi:hypothetical protein ACSU1N_05785 [Thermogladius sp. 4427co]|uniref:hypothetical protein n=1 Tax=Thermogladius sp. 4427co TaxID=3450718 RepID=UPI003F7AA059
MSGPSGQETVLDTFISSMRFERMSQLIHVFPGLFVFLGSLGVLSIILSILYMSQSIPPLTSILLVFFYAFIISASISAYKILKAVTTHFYDSAVVIYYWSRKENFENVLNYLRERREVRNLPSPATGLVLTLLAGGFAYIPLLYFIEKNLRIHVRTEEQILFGTSSIRESSLSDFISDLVLTIGSLGLYLSFWAKRIIYLYNRHIDSVHGNHPNPPKEFRPVAEGGAVGLSMVGLLLIVFGVDIILAYLGFASHYHIALLLGSLLSYYGSKYSDRPHISLLASYALIYAGFVMSTVIGVAGFRNYLSLTEAFRKTAGELKSLGFFQLAFYIFLNNASIAVSSLPPIAGPFILGNGVSNSGVIYGTLLGAGQATPFLFVMPHTPLELLGYALFSTASALLLREDKRFTIYAVAGILVLLTAAMIEASLIV